MFEKIREKSDLVGGFNPSEKYEFVSWDDDIPNWMESIGKSFKILWFQPTNQWSLRDDMIQHVHHGETLHRFPSLQDDAGWFLGFQKDG